MPSESPSQRRARETRENRDRCLEAAARLRHRIAQGRYAELPDTDGDDLLAVAAVLDTAAMQLSELPEQHCRDILHLATRLLDDDPRKRGAVAPLSAGDGH